MIVNEDICTVDQLKVDADHMLDELHRRGRPILLTVAGRPDALLVPIELLDDKQTALAAACELMDTCAA